jgi:hypothetical protein
MSARPHLNELPLPPLGFKSNRILTAAAGNFPTLPRLPSNIPTPRYILSCFSLASSPSVKSASHISFSLFFHMQHHQNPRIRSISVIIAPLAALKAGASFPQHFHHPISHQIFVCVGRPVISHVQNAPSRKI